MALRAQHVHGPPHSCLQNLRCSFTVSRTSALHLRSPIIGWRNERFNLRPFRIRQVVRIVELSHVCFDRFGSSQQRRRFSNQAAFCNQNRVKI